MLLTIRSPGTSLWKRSKKYFVLFHLVCSFLFFLSFPPSVSFKCLVFFFFRFSSVLCSFFQLFCPEVKTKQNSPVLSQLFPFALPTLLKEDILVGMHLLPHWLPSTEALVKNNSLIQMQLHAALKLWTVTAIFPGTLSTFHAYSLPTQCLGSWMYLPNSFVSHFTSVSISHACWFFLGSFLWWDK